MAKIDKIKETLNSLRIALTIISAFIIALGGSLGSFYRSNDFGILFWLVFIFIILFVAIGYIIIHKIKIKTDELEEL